MQTILIEPEPNAGSERSRIVNATEYRIVGDRVWLAHTGDAPAGTVQPTYERVPLDRVYLLDAAGLAPLARR